MTDAKASCDLARAQEDPLPTLAESKVVWWLLVINITVHVLDGLVISKPENVGWLSFWGWFDIRHTMADGGPRQLWRFITYQFLHANLFHLGMNMMALYVFGPLMEKWWGPRRFLVFYLLCGVCGAWFMSALVYLSYATNIPLVSGQSYLVGASGSIFGILVGVALIAPKLEVKLIIPPMWITVRRLAIAFFVISMGGLLLGKNAGGNAAHLGGALFGWLLVRRPWALDWADRDAPSLKPPGKDGSSSEDVSGDGPMKG